MSGANWLGRKVAISVVIPMRDARRTILRALRSIEGQSLQPEEVILVDNGSTDGTLELVAEYHPSFSLRIAECDKLGSGAARNLGIALSRGTHIAFLDADDVWYPGKLLNQHAAIERGCRLIGTYFEYLSESGKVIGDSTRLTGKVPPAIALREAKAMPAPMSSLLIERGLIEKCGVLDESFLRAQDFEWLTRLAQEEDLVLIGSQPLVGYVMGMDTATARTYAEQALAADLVRKMRAGERVSSYHREVTERLGQSQLPRSIRAARAYRLAGIALGEKRWQQFILGITYSLALSPVVTWRKLVRQSVRRTGARDVSPAVHLFVDG